jgi:DNA-binding transcriptional LysR family regulator
MEDLLRGEADIAVRMVRPTQQALVARQIGEVRVGPHLAAVRAGFGIGVVQHGVARRDPNLVPILPDEINMSMDMWLVLHEDLRASRRLRLMCVCDGPSGQGSREYAAATKD